MTDAYNELKLENQLCFPLYAAAREAMKVYKPLLDELDLTYTQYVTMIVVWEMGTVSVGELGRKLHLDSGTLTPLLKTLERKGFVERSRSAKDERVVDVTATQKGLALYDQAVQIPRKLKETKPISEEEAELLMSLLYKFLDGLR